MSKEIVEQLANSFFELMPQFKHKLIKPLEGIAKQTISPLQLHVLFHLCDRGELTMSELAGEMNIFKQQLTFLTDKLEENNFIKRVPDKNDRRSIKISITQSGMEFLDAHKKHTINFLRSRLEQLSVDDMNELGKAIRSMCKILERL